MPNIDEQEEFLRKKIDESTVGYSDQYWQDARQMLGPKRRRKFAWWWLPVFVLLPVIASVSYFSLKENNAGIPKPNHSITSSDAIALSAEKRKSLSTEQPKSTTTSNLSSLNISEKSSQSSLNHNVQTNSIVSNSTYYVTKKDRPALKKSRNIASSSVNTIAANKADNPSNASTNESETSRAQNQDNENISSGNNSTTTKPISDTSSFTLKQTAPANEAAKAAFANSADTIKNSETAAPIPATTNKVDTVSNNTVSKNSFRNKILAISVGCNFNRGINATGGNSFTVGALPYAGISFALPVTPKISIQGGLICNMYNRLNSQTDIHHSNYYGFGYGESVDKSSGQLLPYADTVFSLHQQLLFTLQLPVAFNYYINGKNSFSLGAGIAYTMGVYSKVINFDGSETKSFGYGQGYKPLNVFLQAGYCYNLTKNWAVELNLQQGLTDMTDDAFFNSNRKDRFTNLQVGLKYEFAIKPKKTSNEKN